MEGDWEGPIELFEYGESNDGWVNCTTGYYWHPALGGGIYVHEGETYRNWEFDYEPPEEERVPDQPKNTKGRSQAQMPQPSPQPLPQLPPRETRSKPTPTDPVARRTRAGQKTGGSLDTGDFSPPPLTPTEQKSREDNLSHMTHQREAMKSGMSKWKEELKKEKDTIRKAWLKHQRDILDS